MLTIYVKHPRVRDLVYLDEGKIIQDKDLKKEMYSKYDYTKVVKKNIITLSIFCTLSVILFPFLFTNSFFTNFNLLWIVFLLSIGLVKFKSENEK